MALETLTGNVYIDALNSANPVVADDFDKGVDHLQGIKNVLKKTFANLTGAVTATQGDLNATSTLATDYAGYSRSRKNILMNGQFTVMQRETSIIGITSNEFPADRWRYVASTSGVANTGANATQSASVPFYSGLVIDVTTADATVAAGDYIGLVYKAEGYDTDHLRIGTSGAETVTLSFWHKHTKTGTHCVAVRNSANDRSYILEYTQTTTNIWEQAELTFTLDTSGTWLNTTNVGLSLHFTLMAGTTYQTDAGAWTAGNYLGSSGQVNDFDSTSNYFRLCDVQLELGSAATTFDSVAHADTLMWCRRYFQRVEGQAIAHGSMQSGTNATMMVPLSPPMRPGAAAACVYTVGDHRIRQGGGVNLTPSAFSDFQIDGKGCFMELSATVSGGTQYNACSMRSNNADLDISREF